MGSEAVVYIQGKSFNLVKLTFIAEYKSLLHLILFINILIVFSLFIITLHSSNIYLFKFLLGCPLSNNISLDTFYSPISFGYYLKVKIILVLSKLSSSNFSFGFKGIYFNS